MGVDGSLEDRGELPRKLQLSDFAAASQRPLLPPRQASYSKRHASFGSPREVPLPSPSSLHSHPFQFPTTSATTTATTSSHTHSPLHTQGLLSHSRKSSAAQQQPLEEEDFSVFDEGDESGDDSLPSAPSSPRSSSPSPFRLPDPDLMDDIEPTKYPAASKGLPSDQPHAGTQHTRDPSGGRHGSQSAPQQQLQLPEPPIQPQSMSQLHTQTSSSSSLSSNSAPVFPFSRPYSLPESTSYGPDITLDPPPLKAPWPDRSSTASLPLPMQTPYFTLPKAPPAATVDEGMEWRNALFHGAGAQLEGHQDVPRPPPVPPVQPLPKEIPSQVRLPPPSSDQSSASPLPPTPAMVRSHSSVRAPTSHAHSAAPDYQPIIGSRSLSSQSSNQSSYPPPAPPTIMTPPPPPETHTWAPYEPFLSHAPPPEDSWIVVETTPHEYTLVVRLPGFRRDGITLATRRRRILHVVADSWDHGGGHFERRISFGYDADLSQVRAEFDGELLRVIIPRRLPPVNAWYTPAGQ